MTKENFYRMTFWIIRCHIGISCLNTHHNLTDHINMQQQLTTKLLSKFWGQLWIFNKLIKVGYIYFFFFPLFYINVLIKIVVAVRTKEKQKVNDEGLLKLRPYLCKGTKTILCRTTYEKVYGTYVLNKIKKQK